MTLPQATALVIISVSLTDVWLSLNPETLNVEKISGRITKKTFKRVYWPTSVCVCGGGGGMGGWTAKRQTEEKTEELWWMWSRRSTQNRNLYMRDSIITGTTSQAVNTDELQRRANHQLQWWRRDQKLMRNHATIFRRIQNAFLRAQKPLNIASCHVILALRVVFVGGGKPGNFPLTGSDLPSHWFVWKLRGNGKGEGREREGWGRSPALLPPTGFCLKYHHARTYRVGIFIFLVYYSIFYFDFSASEITTVTVMRCRNSIIIIIIINSSSSS